MIPRLRPMSGTPHDDPETGPTGSVAQGRATPESLPGRGAEAGMLGGLVRLSSSPRRWVPECTSPPRARRHLASHEIELAGYLMARAAIGQAIDSKDISRLQKANDTVAQTRQTFPHGRGNVDVDIAASDQESGRRQRTVRDVLEVLKRAPDTRGLFMHELEARAALAQFVHGGNCAEYASVATVTHTAKLEAEEAVHQVGNRSRGHEWAEARVPEGYDLSIVMDGWAYGPAVLAPDSAFAQRMGYTRYSYTQNMSEMLSNAMAERMNYLNENLGPSVNAHLDRLKQAGFEYTRGLLRPQPVVSAAFRTVVNARLSKPVSPPDGTQHTVHEDQQAALLLDMLATAAARGLGLNVKDATLAAPEIIDAVRRLGVH